MSSLLKPGTYIIAVSGGVDSMVLLDMLRHQADLVLVVAHVNHGIRADTHEDEALVASYAKSHNMIYEVTHLQLGSHPSEAIARNARYKFLRNCRDKYQALAIVTAHHQDDMLETAIINCRRGTGWRGIAPFATTSDIERPLLFYTKKQLYAYAATHQVSWRDDSTNTDLTYMRNDIRHRIMPMYDKVNKEWREDFMRHIRNQSLLCRTINDEISLLATQTIEFMAERASIKRYVIIVLPHSVANELLQVIFKKYCGHSLERPQLESILVFAKVARQGKLMPINSYWQCRVSAGTFVVEPRTPVIS